MKLRKAKKSDFKRCQKIIYDCLKKVKINKIMKAFLRKKYTIKGINKLSKKCDVIVYENASGVQGSGKLCGSEIGMVYVNPSEHRKKIGTAIMKHLEKLAKRKGLKKVHLESLGPAEGFYKKLGYENIKIKKMEKILK